MALRDGDCAHPCEAARLKHDWTCDRQFPVIPVRPSSLRGTFDVPVDKPSRIGSYQRCRAPVARHDSSARTQSRSCRARHQQAVAATTSEPDDHGYGMIPVDVNIHYQTVGDFEGWDRASQAVQEIIARFSAKRIIEIGAGANPTLPIDYIRSNQLDYIANDISEEELRKADQSLPTLCHDFSEERPPLDTISSFDLVFSRMVNEHVRHGRPYYENIYSMLRPGGITAHWFSTLYALPFVLNRVVPEGASSRLLRAFAPRDESIHDKFHAYYSWSRGPTSRMIERYERLGFDVLEYVGYFGHGYYSNRLDLLHRLEMRKSAWLVTHPNPFLTSYAKILLRKR